VAPRNPKIAMRSLRVIGVEVLARWVHPERGLIPPDDFVPMIEDTELGIGPRSAKKTFAQAKIVLDIACLGNRMESSNKGHHERETGI
jgi:EAL domain-containing protein (putative c-di-GMP-specific phosphodiesterase class I)